MFWTDWGEHAKIEKCGMNGDPKTREALITENIMWPNALTIDYTIDRIWWADAKLHTIESSDLEGRRRQIILRQDINHPFALTLFHNFMYWTDWEHHRGSINRANKFNGRDRFVLQESLYSPMGIHVYHRQRQPAGRIFCLLGVLMHQHPKAKFLLLLLLLFAFFLLSAANWSCLQQGFG